MGARWAWTARCRACGQNFSGYSGGPDGCYGCGSYDVVETTHANAMEAANTELADLRLAHEALLTTLSASKSKWVQWVYRNAKAHYEKLRDKPVQPISPLL